MVAPFFGWYSFPIVPFVCLGTDTNCSTFGGWLYDVFLFTGESPVNTPWMGLDRVFRPTAIKWSSHAKARDEERRGVEHA